MNAFSLEVLLPRRGGAAHGSNRGGEENCEQLPIPAGSTQHIVEVHPRVHLGTLHGAWMWEALRERKITHVVNMQDYSLCPQAFAPELFTYFVANEGAGGQGEASAELTSPLTCPRGHALNVLAAIPLWQCSYCGQRRAENPRVRCAACSYDLCRLCCEQMRREPRNRATALEGVAGSSESGAVVSVLSDAVSRSCTELHARGMKAQQIRPSSWWADPRGPLTSSQWSERAGESAAFPCLPRGRARIQETNAFIRQGVQDGGVLVHCCGNALSTAAVAAYLMHAEDMPLDYALDLIESKRPFGYLGSGLLSLLRQYEMSLQSCNPGHTAAFLSWNAPAAAAFSTADGTHGLAPPASCNRHQVLHGEEEEEVTSAGDSFTGVLAHSGPRRRSLRAYLSRPESCVDVRGYLSAEDMGMESNARGSLAGWPTGPQPSVTEASVSGSNQALEQSSRTGRVKRDHIPAAFALPPDTWSDCRTLSHPPTCISGVQPAHELEELAEGALGPRFLF